MAIVVVLPSSYFNFLFRLMNLRSNFQCKKICSEVLYSTYLTLPVLTTRDWEKYQELVVSEGDGEKSYKLQIFDLENIFINRNRWSVRLRQRTSGKIVDTTNRKQKRSIGTKYVPVWLRRSSDYKATQSTIHRHFYKFSVKMKNTVFVAFTLFIVSSDAFTNPRNVMGRLLRVVAKVEPAAITTLRGHRDDNNCSSEQSLTNEEISRYSRHLVLSVSWFVVILCIIYSRGFNLRRLSGGCKWRTHSAWFALSYSFYNYINKGCWNGGSKISKELICLGSWCRGSRIAMLVVSSMIMGIFFLFLLFD